MLKYEWILLKRNKVSRIYFLTSLAAAMVCGVLLFLILKAGFDMPLHIGVMTFFTLGAPLYIFSIYSFSWESSFARMSLRDNAYFIALVKAKLYANFMFPTLAFMFFSLVFFGFLGLSAVRPLFISWIYTVIFGNLMTLWLSSYWIKWVDWYEDQFEIIRQPPGHIIIVLANILLFLLIYYLSNLVDFGLKALLIAGLLIWLLLRPLMVKGTVRNIKKNSYAIPAQPIHQNK